MENNTNSSIESSSNAPLGQSTVDKHKIVNVEPMPSVAKNCVKMCAQHESSDDDSIVHVGKKICISWNRDSVCTALDKDNDCYTKDSTISGEEDISDVRLREDTSEVPNDINPKEDFDLSQYIFLIPINFDQVQQALRSEPTNGEGNVVIVHQTNLNDASVAGRLLTCCAAPTQNPGLKIDLNICARQKLAKPRTPPSPKMEVEKRIKVRKGARTYHCLECGRVFTQKKNLEAHTKAHLNDLL